jgi:DNA repair exonuclease SbcCD ATPase subunit
MLDRYIIIDIEQMISDYDDNKVTLESITEQYNELCEKDIGSIDYSKDRVQSSPVEDAMATAMARKEDLQEKINGYTRYFILFDPAWERLTDKERYILKEFSLYPKREKQKAVDHICDRYGVEVAQVYNLKRDALNRFKRLMFG